MISTHESYIDPNEPRSISLRGFRTEGTAGVATENCFNRGVHLRPYPHFRRMLVEAILPTGLRTSLGSANLNAITGRKNPALGF